MGKAALTIVAALAAAPAAKDVEDIPALSTKKQVAGPKFANCSTRHIEKMVVDGRGLWLLCLT